MIKLAKLRDIQKPLLKNDNKILSFPSPEKSLGFIDSLGMIDHSNVILFKQDALNAAFDNMESFMCDWSVSESHKQDKHKLWQEGASCVQEMPAGRQNQIKMEKSWWIS